MAAGDDGVGVAGLDARRSAAKDGAEARRNGAGARASLRPQVAGGSLSGASTASLSTALAAAELLGSQRFENAVHCASSNGSRVPE
jgi:hypothetical protein